MSEVIIKQEQIQSIDKHGIHFINDNEEADFIAFALSYESIIFTALNFDHDAFGDDEYEIFMEKIPSVPLVAIYDDFLTNFEVYFAQDLTGDLVYKLVLEDKAEYEKFCETVASYGWRICPSSELWST